MRVVQHRSVLHRELLTGSTSLRLNILPRDLSPFTGRTNIKVRTHIRVYKPNTLNQFGHTLSTLPHLTISYLPSLLSPPLTLPQLQHPAFLDVGYSNDYSVLTTDVVVRCGDPKSMTAVELSVPIGIAKSGQPFCPEPYSQFIGAVPNDSGD